jgi:anti-sigma factor RsiW
MQMRTLSSCDSARRLAALAPDEALSEIERRMLVVHLGGCEPCTAFAASVVTFTDQLREASLEPGPDRVTAFMAPRRRKARGRSFVTLTAVAAAAVVVSTVVRSTGSPAPVSGGPPAAASKDFAREILQQPGIISLAMTADRSKRGEPGVFAG